MPARSHLDTWMFCKFVSVNEHDIDNSIVRLPPNRKDKDQLAKAFIKQYPKAENLIFHETYHFWQGVRLPFLHKYGVSMLRGCANAFLELSASGDDFTSWKGSLIHPEFYDLHQRFKVLIIQGDLLFIDISQSIQFQGPDLITLGTIYSEISIIDLLECTATLAEFQFSCNELEETFDPIKFDRWCKRNPAYTDVLRFVCAYLGGDKALVLRFLIPLVNAAFHTTHPLRAFCEILCRLNIQIHTPGSFVEDFINQPEPVKWVKLFEFFLKELKYDNKPQDWQEIKGDGSFQFMNIEGLIGEYRRDEEHPEFRMHMHPILTPLLKEWLALEKSAPENTSTILDCPFLNKKAYVTLWRNFDTLTIMKFNLQHHPFVITYFPNEYVTSLLNLQSIESLFAMVGIIRKTTGINFDNDNQICYHSKCPFFSFNYCNSYLRIPDNFDVCEFPVDISNWIKMSNEYTQSKTSK